MIVGAPSQRPMEFAIGFADREIVDACHALLHQPVFVELPVLVPVGTKPVARIVMPFVREAHGDMCFVEGPKFLDQAIVEFLRPLATQECHDGFASGEELGAVAPLAVDGIDQRDAFGIARVPAVFRAANFLRGALARERWQRRADVRIR